MRSHAVSVEKSRGTRQILNKSSSSSSPPLTPSNEESSPAASGGWTEQMVQLGQICGRRTISRLICKGKGSALRLGRDIVCVLSVGVRRQCVSLLMNDTTASLRQYVSGAISESINYSVLKRLL